MDVNSYRYPDVVFIPQFVIKALERSGVPITKVASDKNLVCSKLSLNYLAYLCCLDNQIKNELATPDSWWYFDGAVEANTSVAKGMSNDPATIKELDTLMYSESKINAEDTFIIYDTQSNLVCVGIKEGFDRNNKTHQLALTKAIIKHWYMYEKQEVVANTNLFNTYLKLLTVNR